MRIAIVNWNDRRIGGAETYLAELMPALRARGHQIAYLCEESTPEGRESIVPDGFAYWCVDRTAPEAILANLEAWGPDLLFVHGLSDPRFEAELQTVAPAAFFAHGYYGTCITGSKTNHFPAVSPCSRVFGLPCLAAFYPRRCGGLNPITMATNFRLQSQRLRLLREYEAVLCASNHMRAEYRRHGIPEERLHLVPYPVKSLIDSPDLPINRQPPTPGHPWRILFVGRLEPQKGVSLLLDAIPIVQRSLNCPVELTLAGAGRERSDLEAKARVLTEKHQGIRIQFTGWLTNEGLVGASREADLLAFPSIWPEPFGLVGMEVAQLGLPAAAFAVGGIPDWLHNGVNGFLAPTNPPTPGGLADAMIHCLDRERYPRLVEGALKVAREYTMDAHLNLLLEVFEQVKPAGEVR